MTVRIPPFHQNPQDEQADDAHGDRGDEDQQQVTGVVRVVISTLQPQFCVQVEAQEPNQRMVEKLFVTRRVSSS